MSELLASLRIKGVSSGNGAVITVAYGAEFYNQTLVATNGTDTVSVLASSSGTADITVPSEGSWVISCTIGADTYTSDPVLVELSYEATITAIPDGSTVLPTDDVETWLECAGITDKAYTTLAEVLADTDTYTTLLGDSNACDYMARSTTWASTIVADADAMRLLGMYDYACDALLSDSTWASAIAGSTYFESVLNVKVPTMTSATTPSGEAGASSTYSGRPAYQAFNGKTISANDGTSFWLPNSTPAYVYYKFTEKVNVVKAKFANQAGSSGSTQIKWMYSDDGTTWEDATELITFNYSTARTVGTYDFPSCGAHQYWAFNLETVRINIGEVQFYGRHETQTDIIVSAPSDTIYYMDNGSPVTLCTTDTDGIGSVDWSDLPTGDITLYSSVAKNPTDLTADYSKSIKVTKNKVEGYLMPDTALYWWGYFSNDVEDVTTANGWSNTYNESWIDYQKNTNNIFFNPNTSGRYSYIGTKHQIANKTFYAYQNTQRLYSNIGFIYGTNTIKKQENGTWSNTTVTGESIVNKSTNGYCWVGASVTRQAILYAWWYE